MSGSRPNLPAAAASLAALLAAATAAAEPPPTVGIEGRAVVTLPLAGYTPRPVDDRSPLVLRLGDVRPDNGAYRYTLYYLGLAPGAFPLSEHLLRPDGEAAAELSNVVLRVRALLPADHDGQLADDPFRAAPRLGGYREALAALAALWIAGLVTLARMNRRVRPPPPPPPAPAPTLADLLRPLAEAAAAGTLDTAGRARLERLLIGYWSGRLALSALPAAEVLPRLREHPEGGLLLRRVEAWLHSPRGASPDEVRDALTPYMAVPAPREEGPA